MGCPDLNLVYVKCLSIMGPAEHPCLHQCYPSPPPRHNHYHHHYLHHYYYPYEFVNVDKITQTLVFDTYICINVFKINLTKKARICLSEAQTPFVFDPAMSFEPDCSSDAYYCLYR